MTFVRGLFKEEFGSGYIYYVLPLFVPSMGSVLILSLRVIAKLTPNLRVIKSLISILLIAIVFRLLGIFVIKDSAIGLYMNVGSSILITVLLSGITYRMIINLFKEGYHIIEKLWASVCVFFFIGAIFGSVYSILMLINPEAIKVTMEHPLEIYLYGMIYSINILSGFDPIYPETSESVQMTALLESTLSMLFLVILIGRLLGGAPEEKRQLDDQ